MVASSDPDGHTLMFSTPARWSSVR
jgi:hypothetical protein